MEKNLLNLWIKRRHPRIGGGEPVLKGVLAGGKRKQPPSFRSWKKGGRSLIHNLFLDGDATILRPRRSNQRQRGGDQRLSESWKPKKKKQKKEEKFPSKGRPYQLLGQCPCLGSGGGRANLRKSRGGERGNVVRGGAIAKKEGKGGSIRYTREEGSSTAKG